MRATILGQLGPTSTFLQYIDTRVPAGFPSPAADYPPSIVRMAYTLTRHLETHLQPVWIGSVFQQFGICPAAFKISAIHILLGRQHARTTDRLHTGQYARPEP